MRSRPFVLACAALATLATRPAEASFHLMQIEEVIGGVNGNTNAQAIQLRMRAPGQNLVAGAMLVAHDAAGANPIVLITFPADVTNAVTGDRILAATSDFTLATSPALAPDFPLTNVIPASYLPAGSLTYESSGIILWRLSWGGASYTGLGSGSLTNDADGDFNPPFPGPLPSTTDQAVLFQFASTAPSTNNANDYALTPGGAVFTSNSGSAGTVQSTAGVGGGQPSIGVALTAPTPNPVRHEMSYAVVLPSEARVDVRVLDLGGRVVGRLMDETMSAGVHHLAWAAANRDGSRLANGLYLLEMNAGATRRTRKFMVLH